MTTAALAAPIAPRPSRTSRRRPILEAPRIVAPCECRQSARDIIGYVGVPRPERETVNCPSCGKTFLGLAVITGDREQDPKTLGHFRPRKLWCDHCDHIVFWLQPCTAGGQLYPGVVHEFGLIRDPKKIAAFLAAHPQAAGVSQN